MKLDALDHPKTFDFAARLDVSMPTALGHLELFWAFVAKKTPQGDVGKWPDGAIARSCYWEGDPDQFIESLVGAGFVMRDDSHRLVVHDWADHMPNWVRAKLKKEGVSVVLAGGDLSVNSNSDLSKGDSPNLSGDLRADLSGDSVREGKGREGNTPHTPQGGEKSTKQKTAVGFKRFIADCQASGEKPIPPDDPVFKYAEDVGIPQHFLLLAWREFESRYSQKDKRYKDWRAVFRNAVQGNWLKLWWISGENGEYLLTSAGKQADKLHQVVSRGA